MVLHVLAPTNQVSAAHFIKFLISEGLLKPGFQQVLHGKTISEIRDYVLEKKLIDSDKLLETFAAFYKLPFTRLVDRPLNPTVIRLLPKEVVEKYHVLPFSLEGLFLSLAIGDPTLLHKNAPFSLTKLRQEKGLSIKLFITPPQDIQAVLRKVYAPASGPAMSPAVTAPAPASVVERPPVPPPPSTTPNPAIAAIAPPSEPAILKKVEDRGKEIDLRQLPIPADVLNRIPYAVARKYKLIVFDYQRPRTQFEPPMIKVALASPDDPHVKEILSYIEQRNKVLVDRYHTSEESFTTALAHYTQADRAKKEEPVLTTKKEAAPPPPPPKPTHRPEATQPVLHQEVEKKPEKAEATIVIEEQPDAVPAVPPPKVPAAAEALPSSAPPGTSTNDVNIAVPEASEVVTLTAQDIINRPIQESAEELQRLANQQQATLEDQNLDRLLKQPVLSAQDLAKVFRSGVIPEIVAAALFLAIRMKASDVHVEAEREYVRIRFRIDGILHDILRVPAFLHAPLISRVKILSKMKIDEQRIPQDGRFDVVIDKRQVDLRVSTLPTVHGEKVVMRLLDKSEGMLTLEQLGMTGSNFDTLIKNIERPYGIILSTGPTGSGKSTTLYSILSRISKPGINIITLEDPVEYELPGLNQAQVKPQIGFTFAEGLRSVLRQDPNVIMVGEIRDLETAAMATHAALTGHLVLSTLHTNDAAGALPRLINMGVEPFLITSSINAVIGQRLVRRLCENCKRKAQIPPAVLNFAQKELSSVPSGQLKNINLEQLVFYEGAGCPECTDGYKGRIGIFEVLDMSEAIEDLAVRKVPASELQKAAVKGGMITMIQDGFMKALKGITTVDEVMRVTTTSIQEVPGVAP